MRGGGWSEGGVRGKGWNGVKSEGKVCWVVCM